jgi:hypothetical protein
MEEDNMESDAEMLTPEWFQEKTKVFPNLEADAEKFRIKFKERFAPDKLKALTGKDVLYTIFLNGVNKTNLCYVLEFDTTSKQIFIGLFN